MTDEDVVRQQVRLMFSVPAGDVAYADVLYHEDAVLEFPQSGERFDGRAAFTEWRSRYPSEVAFEVLRLTVSGDLAVVELTARYDDGPPMFGVGVMEFRDGRIVHERIFVGAGWDAPEWRAPWRSGRPVDSPGL